MDLSLVRPRESRHRLLSFLRKLRVSSLTLPRFITWNGLEISLPEDAVGCNIGGVSYDLSEDKLSLVPSATCLVEFCRRNCPVLPEGASVRRGTGVCLCSCGKPLDLHFTWSYPTGMNHVVRDCNGEYWHL